MENSHLALDTLKRVEGIEAGQDHELLDDVRAIQEHMLSFMVSLLLCLCSEQPDISNWMPKQPTFKYLGNKRQWLASKDVHEWYVGLRLGAALKDARDRLERVELSSEGRNLVRPHVRRAHWNSFWVGMRGEQTISLRWLPPIPVNVNIGVNSDKHSPGKPDMQWRYPPVGRSINPVSRGKILEKGTLCR